MKKKSLAEEHASSHEPYTDIYIEVKNERENG